MYSHKNGKKPGEEEWKKFVDSIDDDNNSRNIVYDIAIAYDLWFADDETGENTNGKKGEN